MCYSEARAIFGHVMLAFVYVLSTCNQISERENEDWICYSSRFILNLNLNEFVLCFFPAML